MKLLYVDANVWHINPTANLLPMLFLECFSDMSFYGPGFSSGTDLACGLRRYVDLTGPYDIIIIGPNTPILAEADNSIQGSISYLLRYTAHKTTNTDLETFFLDVRESLANLDISVKMISTLNLDYYAVTQRQIDIVLESGLGVIGPNAQFVLPIECLPDFAKHEKHYTRKVDRLSDAWYNFLCRYPERVVTAVHFVGQQEFFYEPLDLRANDVAVPGVEYLLRKHAIKQLAQTPFRRASKMYFHAYRLANHFGLPVFSNQVFLRLYNLMFQRTLADTRCVYTARGGFGIPIRKFFEIPAAGALMLCSPCNGLDALGFESGKHYVDVEPAALPDALAHWLHDADAQKIASMGQSLIRARHSASVRGEQIQRCLQEMVAGKFTGASWNEGQYIVNGERATCVG